MNAILIIDDEPLLRKLLARMMELEGYEVFQAADRVSGLKMLELKNPQLVLCDVFLLTAHGNIADGVQAIKNGVFDYIPQGDDSNKIIPIVSRAMEEISRRLSAASAASSAVGSFDAVLGHSECLQKVVRMARKVAETDVPVLLTG